MGFRTPHNDESDFCTLLCLSVAIFEAAFSAGSSLRAESIAVLLTSMKRTCLI